MKFQFSKCAVLGVILLPFGVLGQAGSGPTTMPDISSPAIVSPNAAALGKYGEIPVSYYTGIPNISIPLYEIKTGSLDLPLSLSYHAGGIRVEEVASWVGTGWSLNAGGVITRQLRGLPDEMDGGYLQDYSRLNQYLYGGMSSDDQYQFYHDIEIGRADGQQDIFNYNFGGQAGKFIFDSTGQVITVPRSRIKIEYGTFQGQTASWKITDITGIQYYFANREQSQTIPVLNNALSPSPANYVPTSWYLSKIVNALGTDSIVLTYTTAITTMNSGVSQTRYYYAGGGAGTCSSKSTDSRTSTTHISGWRLSAITFKNGSIVFHPNTQNRCDFPDDFSLSSIEIRNTTGSFDKYYTLYQSYQYANGTSCDPSNPEDARLFLDSVQFTDAANQNREIYSFKYNISQKLPNRFSYSQDHWGYYNGATNGVWLVPTTSVPSQYGGVITLTGANRQVNPAYNQAGMLQSITYPTGGRTEFQYEANTVNHYPGNAVNFQQTTNVTKSFIVQPPSSNTLKFDTSFTLSAGGSAVTLQINNGGGVCAQQDEIGCPLVWITGPGGYNSGNIRTNQTVHNMPDGADTVHVDLRTVSSTIRSNFIFSVSWQQTELSIDSLHHNLTIGGLRIKSITEYSAGNVATNVRQYQYLYPDSVSYSSGFSLSLPEYIGSIKFYSTTSDPSGGTVSICPFTTISSASNYPLESTQSSYVGYKYVTELLGQSGEFGKNVYQFRAPDAVPDIIGLESPFPPAQSRDWQRGQSLVTQAYRYDSSHNTYVLVQEKHNGFSYLATDIYMGLKVSRYQFFSGDVVDNPLLGDYNAAQYGTEVGWVPPMTDTATLYDQNNPAASTQKINSYSYSNVHYQPLTVTTTNSEKDTVITHLSYPLDYIGLTGTDGLTQGIQALQNANIVSPVIENYVQRNAADGSLIGTESAIITSYNPQSLLPDTIWSTQYVKPSPSFTALTVNSGVLAKDAAYIPQVVNHRYDRYGNIIEQRKINSLSHSYIWDYIGVYPVASVVNSDSTNIAYTSFEADGSGNWSIGSGTVNTSAGFTGHNSYDLTGSISKSSLNSGTTYIVSYWSKGGSMSVTGTIAGYPQKGKTVTLGINSWTLYVHKVTGQSTITVSGTGTIDELRLYPATAQMTTYTYDPLLGMTSQTDVANRATYYEYDGLARLKRVRDQDYNILKTLDYQYQATAGCGAGCYILPMQTFAGTASLGYPVGVFNVNGKLLGNAASADDYVTKWNSDAANNQIGTLAKGGDSAHFNLTANSGQIVPSAVTGCRYFQYDLPWHSLDCVIFYNGDYIDWGDGTGMRLGSRGTDTPAVTPPNTSKIFNPYAQTWTFTHSWPNDSLKTITFYHSDDFKSSDLGNYQSITSHTYLQNLRGNLPQRTTSIGGASCQQAGALTVAGIANWTSIASVTTFELIAGDLVTPCEHLNYAQDFMANNRGLNTIITTWTPIGPGYYEAGYRDTTFKLSRLKSDWNTWFTELQDIEISDDHWNREDLSQLKKLRSFFLLSSNYNHNNDPSNNFTLTIPTSVIDSVLIQISAGAGQTVSNGVIYIESGPGASRSSASDAAIQQLVSKGWYIYAAGQAYH